MPASSNDEESTTDSWDSEEDEGERLTPAQELGVARLLLAVRENRLAEATAIVKDIPQELSSTGDKSNETRKVTLKTVQLAEIENHGLADEDVASDVDEIPVTKLAAGQLQISDDDDCASEVGLVEASQQDLPIVASEADMLLDRAFGDVQEDNEKFLRDYFCKHLWKTANDAEPQFLATSRPEEITDDEPTVIVRELEDDLDAVWKAEDHEAKFNFRHELGAKHAITGSHDRKLSDMFDVVKPPSKRALKDKERREEKKMEVEAKKAELVADLIPESACLLTQEDLGADEDYPSDQEWFLCDGCSEPVLPGKVMFVCKDCPDYALCKRCQKDKVRHEHALTRSKCPTSAVPPKTWKLCLSDAPVEVSGGKALAAQILQQLTFAPDPNFKYIGCSTAGEKSSVEELFALAEKKLQERSDQIASDSSPEQPPDKKRLKSTNATNRSSDKSAKRLRCPKAEAATSGAAS